MPISEHIVQRRVEFHETDRVGLIHFSNYFKYMDTAVAEFFRSLDLPGPLTNFWGGTEDEEFDWPYVSVSCDFKKPVGFDDLLQIHIWVERIGGKSMAFEVSFGKDGVEVARGHLVVVCARGVKGQPKAEPIPQEIRKRVAVASGNLPSHSGPS